VENKTNNSTYRQGLTASILSEKTCSVCGKKMVRVYWGDYAYKFGSKYFCSYGCMRKYEKSRPVVKVEEKINRPTLDKIKKKKRSKVND
jgi:hypothetical protein